MMMMRLCSRISLVFHLDVYVQVDIDIDIYVRKPRGGCGTTKSCSMADSRRDDCVQQAHNEARLLGLEDETGLGEMMGSAVVPLGTVQMVTAGDLLVGCFSAGCLTPRGAFVSGMSRLRDCVTQAAGRCTYGTQVRAWLVSIRCIHR
jgi:hypothetical protein